MSKTTMSTESMEKYVAQMCFMGYKYDTSSDGKQFTLSSNSNTETWTSLENGNWLLG